MISSMKGIDGKRAIHYGRQYFIKFPIFILILFGLTGKIEAQTASVNEPRMLAKIYLLSPDEIHLLDDMHLDFATRRIGDFAQVVVTQAELDEIERRGFAVEIIAYPDRSFLVDPQYHTYEETLALMDSIAAEFPNITHLDTIGESQFNGYLIQAIKISDNPEVEEDEPAILYDGQHHAREPVGMEACLAILKHLVNNYGVDPQVTNWVDNIEIWIVPMLNPEGWKYIVDDNLSNPWWRKNQRDNNDNNVFNPNIDGVDLNRNYDFHWTQGGSGSPSSWTYRGPWQFSEKETRAKRDLALAQNFVFSITYHSFGEVVFYPWELNGNPAPDQQLILDLVNNLSSRIPNFQGGGNYGIILADCNGGFSDCWMYGFAGAIEFTVETAPTFIPSGSQALQIAQDNLDGAFFLLERVLSGPALTGLVTDSSTGAPLEATVKILEVFNNSFEPRKSDSLFGRYYRPLLGGAYTVEVSKNGYETQVISNVQVTSSGLTSLDVQLTPTIIVSVDGEQDSQIPRQFLLNQNFPNPFNPETVISYQLPTSSNVKLKVYDILGKEVRTLENRKQTAGSYHVVWNGRNASGVTVSSGVYFYRFDAEMPNGKTYSDIKKMLILK